MKAVASISVIAQTHIVAATYAKNVRVPVQSQRTSQKMIIEIAISPSRAQWKTRGE